MKEKILELRSKGYTYDQIQQELGCSKGTISYHCGDGQKEKTNERNRKNWKKLIHSKIEAFNKIKKLKKKSLKRNLDIKLIYSKICKFNGDSDNMNNLKLEEFMEKYEGKEVKCYLTGDLIDITKPRTYEFDHIIPKSRNGDSSIENLGICTRQANRSKSDMTCEEYLELCKKVILYHETLKNS